jgi:glycosyltransferase involved in cell wall biosynthesis
MNILLINNFYYNRGGDCTYLFYLKKLLEENRHKVVIFSMNHPQNFYSEYSPYFVSYINYAEEVKKKNIYSGIKVLFRSIYCVEARRNIERLIKDTKPDLVHLNNIRHHITPSILWSIKNHNIPVVWTLHDYQLICPNISFVSGGRICEKCKKRKYFWPPLVRCKKDSLLASTLAAIEHTMQILSKVYDLADAYICPSDFLKNKFMEYGFHEEKLLRLNNFIDSSLIDEDQYIGDYYLYIGRLSEEKGVSTLIDAVLKLNYGRLKIVGDGPQKEELSLYVKSKNAANRIEFLNHKPHNEVIELLKKCKFLIVPSEWYENFPYTILEAFACGKPVIGARIGGIPELIKENETGLTFKPGDSDDLRFKIAYLSNHPGKIREMGSSARAYVKQDLSPGKHYEKLMEIYRNAIAGKYNIK